MKTAEEIKKEMFQIIDKYIMAKQPNIDFTCEDRIKLVRLRYELQQLE